MSRLKKLILVAMVACVGVLGSGCAHKYGIAAAPKSGHYYVTEHLFVPRIVEYKVGEDGTFEFVRKVK